jgi:1-acyl-sn-glycerol-3-phosphate acyltransferase
MTSRNSPADAAPAAARHPRGAIHLALLPLQAAYTVYAAAVFLCLALATLPVLLLLPRMGWRRQVVHRMARLIHAVMFMPVRVEGRVPLPDPCIVVANHCSYLDGAVLAAALPPRFGFVIKREMHSVPVAGLLLNLIGSQFVARGGGAGSTRDALRVIRHAASGSSLAFFPEGTFVARPGLLRFHTGAFAAAERSGTPVVPVVIRGTRRCLAPEQFFALPGLISVQVLESIPVPASGADAAALRDATRAAILAVIDEPDALAPGAQP